MNTEKLDNYFTATLNIIKSCQKPSDGMFKKDLDVDKFIPLIRSVIVDYFKNWDADEIIGDTLAYYSLSLNAAILDNPPYPLSEKDGGIAISKRDQLLDAAKTTRSMLGGKMESLQLK